MKTLNTSAETVEHLREKRASECLMNLYRQISPTIQELDGSLMERGKYQRAQDFLRIAWDAIYAARCSVCSNSAAVEKEIENLKRRISEIHA